MTRARAVAASLWDFVVGDDWRAVAWVVVGLLVAWLIHRAGVPAWWVVPVAVLAALTLGVLRNGRPPA